MAVINFTNSAFTTKLLDPTKNKVGEKVKQIDYPGNGQCCFCGESKVANLGGYVCGLWIDADGDFYSIKHTCNTCPQIPQEEHSVKSSHKCHCDLFTVIMRVGCQCGGY